MGSKKGGGWGSEVVALRGRGKHAWRVCWQVGLNEFVRCGRGGGGGKKGGVSGVV